MDSEEEGRLYYRYKLLDVLRKEAESEVIAERLKVEMRLHLNHIDNYLHISSTIKGSQHDEAVIRGR